jgi:hypothetical protein
MTDRELMQMALDALKAMQSYAKAEKKGLLICDESINALRKRLAQPDRKWVGLTDEDIKEIDTEPYWDSVIIDTEGIGDLARQIEAKLKEKNCSD